MFDEFTVKIRESCEEGGIPFARSLAENAADPITKGVATHWLYERQENERAVQLEEQRKQTEATLHLAKNATEASNAAAAAARKSARWTMVAAITTAIAALSIFAQALLPLMKIEELKEDPLVTPLAHQQYVPPESILKSEKSLSTPIQN